MAFMSYWFECVEQGFDHQAHLTSVDNPLENARFQLDHILMIHVASEDFQCPLLLYALERLSIIAFHVIILSMLI